MAALLCTLRHGSGYLDRDITNILLPNLPLEGKHHGCSQKISCANERQRRPHFRNQNKPLNDSYDAIMEVDPPLVKLLLLVVDERAPMFAPE